MMRNFSMKRRGSGQQLLISLDLVVTRQTVLEKLMGKYLFDQQQQSKLFEAFQDHTMNQLLYQNHCPFHKQHSLSNPIPSITETEQQSLVPQPQQIKLESDANNMKPKLPPTFQLPPLKKTAIDNKEQEKTNITLSHIILKKKLSLDALASDDIKSKSSESTQSIIKRRDCNKMMGDSMLHFLKLYFQVILQDPNSRDPDNNFDLILLERYIKYLVTLHKDYLTGDYYRNKRRITEINAALQDIEEEKDNVSNEDDVSYDIPGLNHTNEISMDEYRIFVEYMCEIFEKDVMRKHPGFQEGDLILLESLRYHLSKLALTLAGKIPPESLVRHDTKLTAYQRFFSLMSQKTIQRLVPVLKKSSRSSVY